MPTALTPVRIARISRESFQNTQEAVELDFQLAHRQGIILHAIEFGIGGVVFVPGSDQEDDNAILSIHAETEELEAVGDALVDSFQLNSEVLAEAILHVSGSATAGEQTGNKYTWMSPISWRFPELIGEPLLLATNLTFRGVTSDAGLTVNGAFARLYYQYVTLTTQELANQFILRR